MKKLALFLLMGLVLVSFVGAEECQLATPRYGVVQCMNTHQEETFYKNFDCEDDYCSTDVPCLSNCEASVLYGEGNCPFGYFRHYNIIKNGDNLEEIKSISWNRDDSLIIKAYCKIPLIGDIKPINPYYPNAKISYEQDKIMLYEGWAGSLPNTPVSGTEGCILNKEFGDTNVDSYLDPSSEEIKNKPSSSYSSINQFPQNWKINDHYIFVKNWQTGLADISLTYDKNNNAYWCGGQYGSRKIYGVEEVTSSTGNCYAIPQSISISNTECCFPSDCIDNFGAEYTCNPENWKCEKTKPCNSQLECDSVFGEGVCQNGQINKWVCDLTKKWGDYVGTCVHSSKQVSECPSDCKSKEYYNEGQGKCLPRKGLTSENLEDTGMTGAITGVSEKSSTGIIILIIFLTLIGSSIGFFFYTKNKKTKLKKEVKKELKTKGKHCTKCGSILNPKDKFCIKCGRRV